MRKKLVCVLCAASMAAAMMGCGGSAGEKSPETAAEESKELNFLGFNAAFNPNEDIMAKAAEEVTGYQVTYSMLPAENADEKLNVELSSGGAYDIVKLGTSQYFKLVQQGAFQPLDDLIDQYGPNLKKAVSEKSWNACRYDGKIYAIPMRQEFTKDVGNFIIARQDILDELNIEIPQTLDEFYGALKIVKEKKPDMIPLTGPVQDKAGGGDAAVFPAPVTSAFGVYNEWQEIDGKLVPTVENPGTKPLLKFMRKLYEEGLIDREWPINTGQIVNEKFTSGQAVFAMSDRNVATNIIPQLKQNVPEAEVGYVLPLLGENGEQGENVTDKILYFSAIPATSKKAVDAIKWMDKKQEEANFTYLTLGVEGEHFKIEDGEYIPIMPKFSEERFWSYWYLNSIDEEHYPKMWLARLRKSPDMWEIFEKVTLASEHLAKPDLTGYMPPTENVARYKQTLSKTANDYFIKAISGTEEIDQTYDSFVEKWRKDGGDAMKEEINAWYREFYQEEKKG